VLLAAPPISPTPPGETAVLFTSIANDTPTPTRDTPTIEPTAATEFYRLFLPDLDPGP